jgi:hypothetical protein
MGRQGDWEDRDPSVKVAFVRIEGLASGTFVAGATQFIQVACGFLRNAMLGGRRVRQE